MESRTYENFPARIVILSNSVSILIYISGFVIALRLGLAAGLTYIFLILAFEYRLIARHCINCYYWNKTCGFGKGKVSALFFKRGDSSKFCAKEMTWKDMIPDILISLAPILCGIVLMILKFDFILLLAVLLILALSTAGNGYIRGSLTCKFCRQREMGCPAEKMFRKEN